MVDEQLNTSDELIQSRRDTMNLVGEYVRRTETLKNVGSCKCNTESCPTYNLHFSINDSLEIDTAHVVLNHFVVKTVVLQILVSQSAHLHNVSSLFEEHVHHTVLSYTKPCMFTKCVPRINATTLLIV